jgi:hypothetical protein
MVHVDEQVLNVLELLVAQCLECLLLAVQVDLLLI